MNNTESLQNLSSWKFRNIPPKDGLKSADKSYSRKSNHLKYLNIDVDYIHLICQVHVFNPSSQTAPFTAHILSLHFLNRKPNTRNNYQTIQHKNNQRR